MNLYIGNLSYNVKESDLRNVMEEYGTVASVKLITDRETRRSKGFAFIEMPGCQLSGNLFALFFLQFYLSKAPNTVFSRHRQVI